MAHNGGRTLTADTAGIYLLLFFYVLICSVVGSVFSFSLCFSVVVIIVFIIINFYLGIGDFLITLLNFFIYFY